MTTVDNFLHTLKNYGLENFASKVDKKDLKVLNSLATSIHLPTFITENQAKLMHKILYKHLDQFSLIDPNLEIVLLRNSWSKPFRVIDQIRKMYLDKSENLIILEFTHNLAIRKVLANIDKFLNAGRVGMYTPVSGKNMRYQLTEENIVKLITALKPFKFEIDEKILEFYEIIKTYKISDAVEQFTVGEKLNPSIKSALEKELGEFSSISAEKIIDRQLRYQYFLENSEKIEKNVENLKDQVIFRSQPKVWIDSTKFSLEEIFQELKNLERFPALLVFDSWNDDSCVENIEKFSENLEKTEISGPVGIYFRLQNDEKGKKFNEYIKEKKYNAHLDDSTLIAGVQSGKLPKFFLKDCSWTPKSVIVLGTTLRHSKTAVYANRCDLIISYSEKESIIESSPIQWRKSN